jgi:hypothetical protein
MGEATYRVVAVQIETGKPDFVMAEGQTERNAEAIVKLAVMRRGVNEHFYRIEAETPTPENPNERE